MYYNIGTWNWDWNTEYPLSPKLTAYGNGKKEVIVNSCSGSE
jgi:hypothetical protein